MPTLGKKLVDDAGDEERDAWHPKGNFEYTRGGREGVASELT